MVIYLYLNILHALSLKSVGLLPPTNEVWGKVIFSVACVKNSVDRGAASVPAGIPPPPPARQTPLARQTPSGKADPPCEVHAGRYGQQAGGMHPTGMQSC